MATVNKNADELEEFVCGLEACARALCAVGITTTSAKLLDVHLSAGRCIHRFGLSSAEIAALAIRSGASVRLTSASRWLRALQDWPHGDRATEGSIESICGLRAILELRKNPASLCLAPARACPRRYSLLQRCLGAGGCAIACVSALSCFGIDEPWNHYVVVSDLTSESVRVIDAYAIRRGLITPTDVSFWRRWDGDLIEVYGNPAHVEAECSEGT